MIDKKVLQKLIDKGRTIWEMTKELKFSINTIQKYIKYHGIEVPKRGFYSTGKKLGRPKGIPMAEWQKQLLSKRFKGSSNPFFGEKHTEETKKKMSENHADFTGDNNPFRRSLLKDESKRRDHEKRSKELWDSRSEEYMKRFSKRMQSGYMDISGSVWSNIKSGANKRNIGFMITLEDIWDLFIEQDGKCALTGMDLIFSNDIKKVTASLDRIDSADCYRKGNIQWVHKRINMMKNAMKDEEFIEFCRKVANNNVKSSN